MSVLYCDFCDEYVDTDFNAEHYTGGGKCCAELVSELEEEGLTEEEIQEQLEE